MPESLRSLLAQALPDTLAPSVTRAEAAPEPAPPRKEGGPPPNLLATDDPVVHAAQLPAVAQYLRDHMGYTLLTNISAVDYLSDGLIEVVYHFVNIDGGPAQAIKVRAPRDNPHVPSLTPLWPGADLQEREAYDLFGVLFDGHPNLRRIYMWHEFEGFPMRKDFPKQGDKYFNDDTTE